MNYILYDGIFVHKSKLYYMNFFIHIYTRPERQLKKTYKTTTHRRRRNAGRKQEIKNKEIKITIKNI